MLETKQITEEIADKTEIIPGSKPLKGKREKFAQLLSSLTKNQTEAAKEAGYKEHEGLSRYATELAHNPTIQARIAFLTAETAKKLNITRESVMKDILEGQEIARINGDAGNILRAAELKGKALGMFTDRIVNATEQRQLDEHQKAEAKKIAQIRLDESLKHYGSNNLETNLKQG